VKYIFKMRVVFPILFLSLATAGAAFADPACDKVDCASDATSDALREKCCPKTGGVGENRENIPCEYKNNTTGTSGNGVDTDTAIQKDSKKAQDAG
jgi:hypothetical protein